jgi:hypothetical protein
MKSKISASSLRPFRKASETVGRTGVAAEREDGETKVTTPIARAKRAAFLAR